MANPNPKRENLKSFKPNWYHTPTRTIRVPSELADEIMVYARNLDADLANADDVKIQSEKNDSITDTSELLELLTEIEQLKGKGALSKAKSLATKCKKLIDQ